LRPISRVVEIEGTAKRGSTRQATEADGMAKQFEVQFATEAVG
jgi:hypothetical protein